MHTTLSAPAPIDPNRASEGRIEVPRAARRLSLIVAILGFASAVVALLFDVIYALEAENWRGQAIGQDVVNLAAFPLLFWSARRLTRGTLGVFVMWSGLLTYSAYTFAIYAFAVTFGPLFLVYVAVFGGSVYACGLSFAALARTQCIGTPPTRRAARRLLLTIGTLFTMLWLAEIVPAILEGERPRALLDAGLVTNPVHVLDLALLLPAMFVTGQGLLRERAWASVAAPILLVAATWIAVGILAAMVTLTVRGAAFAPVPFVMVAALTIAQVVVTTAILRPARRSGTLTG